MWCPFQCAKYVSPAKTVSRAAVKEVPGEATAARRATKAMSTRLTRDTGFAHPVMRWVVSPVGFVLAACDLCIFYCCTCMCFVCSYSNA